MENKVCITIKSYEHNEFINKMAKKYGFYEMFAQVLCFNAETRDTTWLFANSKYKPTELTTDELLDWFTKVDLMNKATILGHRVYRSPHFNNIKIGCKWFKVDDLRATIRVVKILGRNSVQTSEGLVRIKDMEDVLSVLRRLPVAKS